MSLVEQLRPLPPEIFSVPFPTHPTQENFAYQGSFADDGAEYDTNPALDELLPRCTPRPLGRVLAVLAMLAAVGAGASLTIALMDYHARQSVAAAMQPSIESSTTLESTGSVPAHENKAVPHSVWAPFVNAMPSVGFRPDDVK